ncbi:hypothetical protein WJX73_005911 [Symbiochloris irregularis]|uniref:Uncharacterized protein n=1 Tax=Symbiochloris irregularis TaxID=706552 RepID=A0AAW1PWG6_9CHLO
MKEHTKPNLLHVRFGISERTLIRKQLEKAPDSLLSTALLTKEINNDAATLEIPSKRSRGAAPDFAAWEDGSDDLFHASMNCSLDDVDQILDRGSPKVIPAPLLIPALEYFNLPVSLWPPGVRMVKNTAEMRQGFTEHLKKRMEKAVQMMVSDLQPGKTLLSSRTARHQRRPSASSKALSRAKRESCS